MHRKNFETSSTATETAGGGYLEDAARRRETLTGMAGGGASTPSATVCVSPGQHRTEQRCVNRRVAGGAGSRRGSMQPLKRRPVRTSAGSSMPERHGSRRRRDSPGRHGMKNRRTTGGSTAAQCLARGTGRDTSENGSRRGRVQAAARRGGAGSGGVGPRRDGARGSGAAREPAAQDLAGTARGGDQETRLTSHQRVAGGR